MRHTILLLMLCALASAQTSGSACIGPALDCSMSDPTACCLYPAINCTAISGRNLCALNPAAIPALMSYNNGIL